MQRACASYSAGAIRPERSYLHIYIYTYIYIYAYIYICAYISADPFCGRACWTSPVTSFVHHTSLYHATTHRHIVVTTYNIYIYIYIRRPILRSSVLEYHWRRTPPNWECKCGVVSSMSLGCVVGTLPLSEGFNPMPSSALETLPATGSLYRNMLLQTRSCLNTCMLL